MTRPEKERQQVVLEILKKLRGLDPLKKLFWSELNYQHVNDSLSRRGWTDTAAKALAEDPLLLAAGGQDNGFQIIYAHLASDQLLLGHERPVVSRLLKDHSYTLFVFSNEAQDRWHFVNVKYTQEIAKRRLFRRITVGPEERLRTASERLAMLDLDKPVQALFDAPPLAIQQVHDEAFDVEAVQKKFFKIFADLYHKVAEDIAKVHGLKSEAGKLAQLLLDRMLFLYFIQKKGWLSQELDYLYARFQKCWREDPEGCSYYSNVLYPLFLCLSSPDTQMESVGKVPFLNGGLFEESAQADRIAQARLQVRNLTFKSIFDDLLERFNFTVTEDTPLDVEVAIDPEMLGKIFESLILQLEKDPDKDLRKLTGSYYTPRPIVHFMCQESLKEYLATQLAAGEASREEAARERVGELLSLPPADQLDDEQVRTLSKLFTNAEAKALRQAVLDCRVCDPAVGSGAFPVGILHEMVAAVARLDMLCHGRTILEQRNYYYDLKKQIIESCLYGVDIQEQAVRLCELRLWLSLVVDYQIDPDKPFSRAIREIPSLPNLSYRIVRGDSLLERLFGHVVQLDEMAKDARTKQLIESIQADKQAYFREGNTGEKRRLELKILAKQANLAEILIEAKHARLIHSTPGMFGEEYMRAKERRAKAEREAQVRGLADLKAKVNKTKQELNRLARRDTYINRGDLDALRRQFFQTGDYPTFIWYLDFAEVFKEKGGFDIVIGNPPYAGFHGMINEYKNILKASYYCAQGRYDYYMPFIEKGLQILSANQCLTFICPSTFLKREGGKGIRKLIRQKYGISKIVDFGDQLIFEEATNYTGIYTFTTSQPEALLVESARYTRHELNLTCTNYFPGFLTHNDSIWFFPTGPASKVWQRLNEGYFNTLGDMFIISEGIVTGKNDVFLLDFSKAINFGIEKGIIYPCIRGSEIHTFTVDEPKEYLIYPYDPKNGKVYSETYLKNHFPLAYRYLQSKREILSGRGYFDRSNKRWYELWNERNVKNLVCNKIVVSELGDRNSFAISPREYLYGDTVCGLVPKNKDIDLYTMVAVLNSSFINYYFRQLLVPKANNYIIFKPLYLKEIPLPNIGNNDSKRLHFLSVQLINQAPEKESNFEIKKEIDQIIYNLYGLTGNEISIIEEAR